MRMKAPLGDGVINSKDLSETEVFNEIMASYGLDSDCPELSATNHNVVFRNTSEDDDVCEAENINNGRHGLEMSDSDINREGLDTCTPANTSESLMNETDDEQSQYSEMDVKQPLTDETSANEIVENTTPPTTPTSAAQFLSRDRKLSLDHTFLTRDDSRTQSDFNLYSHGKSPLERKSSFFKKKMESFFKNTTEIFKRQSLTNKTLSNRRGSISASLQSLNENSISNFESTSKLNKEPLGSTRSVYSSAAAVQRSASARSVAGPEDADTPREITLPTQLPAEQAQSVHSVNETCSEEASLHSRAISMSSGLDQGPLRRKSSARLKERANRVTWIASEGLTNYFRRLVQDESGEMQSSHSIADLSGLRKEDAYGKKLDSKGRRLSYQRAVSGEDPFKYQDSLGRRHHIPEHSEVNFELSNTLAEYTRNGVPPVHSFNIVDLPDEALAYLVWAEEPENLVHYYDAEELPPSEETRQAVIREFVCTEATYIQHLKSVVQVFMSSMVALQHEGKLLDISTERLYTNLPEVLNANMCFWEIGVHPMIHDAVVHKIPFNAERMAHAFCHFNEIFQPYEKYVSEQTRALDYLRSLSNNSDFQIYLSWCHSQPQCHRLQLSDILVKPMQRLTKYSLLMCRIIQNTDAEPDRSNLVAMESFAKNYVIDVNRSIRQKEEIEKLDALSCSIEGYEVDFKDDEMDKYFRMFSQLNLRAPMRGCVPGHSRSIIHQGDLRFKDNLKEMEVRVILLTDMILVSKKLSKGSPYQYKLIRPKYMIDKMLQFPKYASNNSKDLTGIIFLMLDEVSSSTTSFQLTASSKDSSPHPTLKLWELKIKEAKLTYDIAVWFARNPSRDITDVELDTSSDYGGSGTTNPHKSTRSSDDVNIEREARERVAAMLHPSMGISTDCEFSQASMNSDSFDAGDQPATGSRSGLRHPMHRKSTDSSRNSRLSSFQYSTSGASHDEPPAALSRYNYRAGSSVEHLIPPQNPDDAVTSITVNVVSESESETVVPNDQRTSTSNMCTRSGSVVSHSTLRVQPTSGVMALVHSLPDLTVEPSSPRPQQSVTPTVPEKLYQSHNELLQRNRLSASSHQYLSPDHRGTSYPPPSPTRAALRRGLAFSYSFKNPPLAKMGHVYSQSQLPAEAGPSSSHHLMPSPGGGEKSDKADKKKHLSGRNKGPSSSESQPAASRKDMKDVSKPGSSRKEEKEEAQGGASRKDKKKGDSLPSHPSKD